MRVGVASWVWIKQSLALMRQAPTTEVVRYASVSTSACLVSPYSICCPCNLPARFNTNPALPFRIRGTYARFKLFWLLRFETREFHSTDTILNENQMKSKERRESYEIERRAALYACSTPHGSVHYRSCDGKRVNM